MSVSVFAVKASSLSKYNSLDCIKASLRVARVPRRPFIGDCRNSLSSKTHTFGIDGSDPS